MVSEHKDELPRQQHLVVVRPYVQFSEKAGLGLGLSREEATQGRRG